MTARIPAHPFDIFPDAAGVVNQPTITALETKGMHRYRWHYRTPADVRSGNPDFQVVMETPGIGCDYMVVAEYVNNRCVVVVHGGPGPALVEAVFPYRDLKNDMGPALAYNEACTFVIAQVTSELIEEIA